MLATFATIAASLFAPLLAAEPPLAAAPALQTAEPPAPPAAILRHGGAAVSVSERGVVLGAAGRELHVEMLHDVVVPGRVHSWIGVSFAGARGRVDGVIPGDAPDYGARRVALLRSFQASPGRFVAVHRLDEVEIEVAYEWQPAVGALINAITLKNLGSADVTDPIVTVEWQLPGTAGTTWPPEFSAMLPPPPQDVHRLGLMPNNLRPGDAQESGVVYRPELGVGPLASELPLRLWTNSRWPGGVNFGSVLGGVSTGDLDQDGFSDLFVCFTGGVFRNVNGLDWSKIADLNDEMGADEGRYGSAICDYDNDGLPDLGSEPRAWITWCYDLMRNEGGGSFRNVANDPGIIDVVPCNGDCETLAVGDVDGDADLDWFLPAYPDWVFDGPGNFFLQNLGPAGPAGEFTFHEASFEANLDNPDGVNRPEGAELCDVDGDGDLDLYSNGTLYRNVSMLGTPAFEWLFGDGTGITNGHQLEEGVRFLDYDMDGDFDLLLSFTAPSLGLRIYESYGDGMWFLTTKSLFDAADVGTIFGCSAADWDNDGDLDVTSTTTFRRNRLLEDGQRHFTVLTHDIDQAQWGHGTPAWFDFDLDGDLDCAFDGVGGIWFLENTTYDATTPSASKRHVRVRVVRDDPALDRGLETEYGAVVALDVLGAAADGRARVQQLSSSAGYLNQGEYTLHFALPADPDPRDDEDVHFALSVDFKGAAEQHFPRVDRHVNPVLGDIDLAELEAAGEREIVVYRSGRVQIAGCDFLPARAAQPLLTTTGGLAKPGSTTPLPAPVATPAGSWYVGAEVVVDPGAPAQHVEELIVDGVLTAADDCNGASGNVFAWDLTDPSQPVLLPGGVLERATPARNRRAALPVDFTLAPGRTYRIVARVSQLRASPIAAPVTDGALTTTGGLSFRAPDPCDGIEIVNATVDPAAAYVALRFREEPGGAWADFGHGYAAGGTPPVLTGSGDLTPGSTLALDVAGAPPSATWLLVAGMTPLCLPFADGVLVPSVDLVLYGTTAPDGSAHWSETWPGCLDGGDSFFVQALIVDPAAPRRFAFSNGLVATVPY